MKTDNSLRKIFAIMLFLIFLVAVFAMLSGFVLGGDGVKVTEGKNIVSFNISSPFRVSSLVELNPEIEVVSYQASEGTEGFVNLFGGIGKDFEIQSGVDYEIYSSQNTTLILP